MSMAELRGEGFDHDRHVQLCAGALTKRQAEVLQQMADHPNDDQGEAVYERGEAWVSDMKIAGRTLNNLIRMMAVSESHGWTGLNRTVERYRINETGRAILAAYRKAGRGRG